MVTTTPPEATNGPLSPEQLAFFRRYGYLIVPGALDPEGCAAARDLMWSQLPAGSSLKRDVPATHFGPQPEAEQDDNALHFRDAYRWLNRRAGVNPMIIDLVYSASICAMAEQLLGAPLREVVKDGTPMGSQGPAWPNGPTDPALGTEGARGIYCTLPRREAVAASDARDIDACHTDGHPFQLGLVALLDDTPANGGAFTVWPGSHARLFHSFKLRYDQPRIPYYDHLPTLKGIVHTDEYLETLEAIKGDTAPVACWGRAGDIVFWHHRTAHMAGVNRSTVIRQALLADFWRQDFDALRARSVDRDMWEDWSATLAAADGVCSDAFTRTQHLGS